ncbi:EthD family reductase [Nakamurella leprariae]|uniref:EthD family reductase n=1 Tax=Nakamurella leprariae TaxID=2803911 RepID=A0A938Y958_9ACTN|nr:EthD family reductase [Nakamurella leprariae]MBM9468346.1 EthD family reductase [Nakamurella leprariae]
MIKLTVLYQEPADPEAFREHYLNVHSPLVRALPGLDKFEVAFAAPGPDGSKPPFHLVSELWFPDAATFGAAMQTPEGAALAADTPNVASTPSTSVITEIV